MENRIKYVQLTADPDTGEPFREAIGFSSTGGQSPGNRMDIYEKAVSFDWYERGILKPLTEKTAAEINDWEYESPYDAYSFKGHTNNYLMDRSIWGTEQFCLMGDGIVIGQVACQYDGTDLWVGWSMVPQLCGKGNGAAFVEKCVKELRRVKKHRGRIVLRVAAWNQRAIRAYQKAGFTYVETIQDEIAFSNHLEDFWVMEL